MSRGIVAVLFVCSRCGRSHTPEEHVASQFCRACGTLLTARHAVTAPPSSVQRQEAGGGLVFPYTPYPPQRAFMKDIRAVVGGGVLVAEACNGFGKTICVLASLLPMKHRIVYATRTQEQVRQVLWEVEAINRGAGQDFSAVHLASRLHLCLHERIKASQPWMLQRRVACWRRRNDVLIDGSLRFPSPSRRCCRSTASGRWAGPDASARTSWRGGQRRPAP